MRLFYCLVICIFICAACGRYHEKLAKTAKTKAELYFAKHNYEQANAFFSIASSIKKSAGSTEMAAISAYKIGELDKALGIYLALDRKSLLGEKALIQYANLLKTKGNYVNAKKIYGRIKNSAQFPANYIKRQIDFCDSARFLLARKNKNQIRNLEKLNTSYVEISPFWYKDTLYFASDKEGIVIKPSQYIDGKPPFHVYSSTYNSKIEYGFKTPKLLSHPSDFAEYVNMSFLSFTQNRRKMYFSCTSHFKFYEDDSSYRIKMYTTEIDSLGKWTKPHTFIMNDLPNSFAQPFVDHKNTMFFFVSDMKGGFGGTDIWVCINIDNKWTDPINLGSEINTSGNELFPFYHEDGTLYFSSDFHPGFGGFDLFKSNQNEGEWGKVINMGVDINSIANDVSISMNDTKSKIIFASDRQGGKGKYDLYMVEK